MMVVAVAVAFAACDQVFPYTAKHAGFGDAKSDSGLLDQGKITDSMVGDLVSDWRSGETGSDSQAGDLQGDAAADSNAGDLQSDAAADVTDLGGSCENTCTEMDSKRCVLPCPSGTVECEEVGADTYWCFNVTAGGNQTPCFRSTQPGSTADCSMCLNAAGDGCEP